MTPNPPTLLQCVAGIGLLLLSAATCAAPPTVAKDEPTPESVGRLDVRTLVRDIDVRMPYAGSGNFVGRPVDGYGAARCYLLAPAAQALQRVEVALRREDLRLRVFDCYRPMRAVRDFVRWAGDESDQRTRATFYPRLRKDQLLGDYISPTSGHSRGATIDLTLMDCERRTGACKPLDMGTPFDFFDTTAHTDSDAVTRQQHRNRVRLREAMEREGFGNYPLEWWHYTLQPEPAPVTFHDAPIR